MIDPAGYNELKLCRSGPMLFNKNDWPIGESLRLYGEYSWLEVELFRKLIAPDSLAIDVGANIGTHTVEMSRMAKFVLAWEPQRIAYQTLCANLQLNHCLNVRTFYAALGAKRGSIIVPMRDQHHINNFGGVQLAGVTEGEDTELMALDQMQFTSVGFIKVDIEGMEAEFLQGAEKTISEHRPILYMEADGAQGKEALKMLMDWKYACYWSTFPLYSRSNFARNTENVFKADGKLICSSNILCFPIERDILVMGSTRIRSSDEVMPCVVNAESEEDFV